jgi:hypothetical protein
VAGDITVLLRPPAWDREALWATDRTAKAPQPPSQAQLLREMFVPFAAEEVVTDEDLGRGADGRMCKSPLAVAAHGVDAMKGIVEWGWGDDVAAEVSDAAKVVQRREPAGRDSGADLSAATIRYMPLLATTPRSLKEESRQSSRRTSASSPLETARSEDNESRTDADADGQQGDDYPARPAEGGGWINTGDYFPATSRCCSLLDVIPGCDTRVRMFAWTSFGWSLASEPSPAYWLPDMPFQEDASDTTITVSIADRCPPPLQLQVQNCGSDVVNGAPLEWQPTPP